MENCENIKKMSFKGLEKLLWNILFIAGYCDVLTTTGAYSCAQANFLLKRVASVKVKTAIYSLIFFHVSLDGKMDDNRC